MRLVSCGIQVYGYIPKLLETAPLSGMTARQGTAFA